MIITTKLDVIQLLLINFTESMSEYNEFLMWFCTFYRARHKKSNSLGKILHLWNCSRHIHQICVVYRRGFSSHIWQLLLK